METNQHKVAIIGMSGYFPEASDLHHFGQNLSAGRDSVRTVPANRLIDSRMLVVDNQYQLTGALEQVAEFDHAFFGLSKQDADCMDPMHRIGLELACQAIERAGYGLAAFGGSNTGVFLGAKPRSEYYTLLDDLTNPAVDTGNLPALFAGRIAFSLNLSGPAYMIDTACSSALAAVHEACQKLIYGEIDYALAGAVSVMTGFFERQQSDALGIMSPDGKARTFDASANGTSVGEGGGMVLLKRYEQALADQDPILAVILGSAANQDGARSNGLTAPSPAAQTEVITKAWKRAAIDPTTITYIEAHGTGTKLGDPIEMKGITDAFKTVTHKRNFCAVSSVKTNIGHLDNAAGMAGLLKAVLSLQAKKLFPSLHFTRINPFIDLTDSAVYVNASLADWCPEADMPRRCGVSSFGLSGTNVHIVLEEGNIPVDAEPSDSLPIRLKLSAKSPGALKAYAQRIRESLLPDNSDWQNVVYTLNTGRSDYGYRAAITATDKNDLLAQLIDLADLTVKPVNNNPAAVVLLLADDAVSSANVAQWLINEPLFQTIYQSVQAEVVPGTMNPVAKKVLRQVAMVRFLEKLGVNSTVMIANGIGKLVREIISGKQTISQVLAQLAQDDLPAEEAPDPEKLRQAIQTLSVKHPNLVFIEPGYGSRLASCLRSVADTATILSLADSSTAHPLRVTDLYNAGLPITWKALYESQGYSRTDAPTYPFERVRCWPFEAVAVASNTPKNPQPELAAQTLTTPAQQTDPLDGMPVIDRVQAVFCDILKATDIDADDDFFEIGGHSINGAQVANRLADLFDLDISLDTIFEYGTIRQLAEYIEPLLVQTGTPKDAPGGIVAIQPQVDYPLSQMQQRIWFLSQFSDAHLAYNMVLAAHIEGVLNPVLFEQALNAVYNRHDSLRTTFHSRPDGPRQIINPMGITKPGWAYREADDVSALEREEWLADERRIPFDLENGPLVRAKAMALPDQQTVLMVSIHHLIADGWSMNVLMDELIQAYEQLTAGQSVNLPDLPVQYNDFVAWQQGQTSSDAHRQAHAFWRDQLAGPLPTLDLPTDKPRPALKSYRGAICHRALPPALTQAALRYGETNGYTLFMLLRATISLLLYRYTGQRDLIVGSPFNGRTNRTLEGQIGLFMNVVGLRTQLDTQQTLADLLAQIKAQTIQAYAHQQYPFDELIDELALHRDLSRSPLFDVLLAVQNHVMTDRDYTIAGHRTTSFATPEISSKYDLSFYVESGTNDLAIAVEYCTDLFEPATIDRMLTHLEAILGQLVTQPEQLVQDLDIVSADEWQQVVVDFNQTDQTYDLSRPVHEHFEEQVTRTPNAVALRYKQRSYTYAQLNEHANKLAHYLIAEQGIKPDDLVAVMAGRSDFTLIALLGIMKAGAAYLPVAADLPTERIRYMLSDSGVQVVLASQFVGEVATAVRHVAYIEQLLQTKHSTTNPAVALSTQSRMYVMYTSGSTGKPKGVELRHRSVLNFLFSMQAYFGLAPEQVFLSVTTFIFDISVMEFFLPLLNGASVRIATKADIQDPDQLAELIEQAQPDLMQATPSLWQMLVDTGWKGHKTMRILCGGEKLSRPLGEQLLSRGRELWNLYGPTETTIWSAIQPVQTTADLATIGKPIANTQVYIVDPIGNLCGLGVFGEICIAGEGLAQGYLNRPDLTSAKFVPNLTDANSLMYRTGDRGRWLANGEIEFLGRSDNQVKIHGHRIELGEIEEVLLNYAGISQAVVTVHDGGQNDKELVAYLVVDQEVRVEDIRQHVGRHVASYMIPTRFLRVRTMPMTANQKVDRPALCPALGEGLSQPVSVSQPEVLIDTVLEKQIAAAVCQVLKMATVGVTDNLFEYGLNSIRVIGLYQLLMEIQPGSVNIHDIFNHPSVRQLTRLINTRLEVDSALTQFSDSSGIVAVAEQADYPLSPMQQRIWFLSQFSDAHLAYNMVLAAHVEGILDPVLFEQALNVVYNRHDSLRTTFHSHPDGPRQVISPTGTTQPGWVYRNAPDATTAERDEWLADEHRQPFNLVNGPLLRAKAMTLPDRQTLLTVSIHHLIADGWSMNVLMDELIQAYEQLVAGQPVDWSALPVQYTDFVAWQQEQTRSDAHRQAHAFWRDQLAGPLPTLDFPTDKPRPSLKSYRGAICHRTLTPALTQAAMRYGEANGYTLFMLLRATISLLLYRYTGQRDMIVGSPFSGRTNRILEGQIGLFMNVVGLRTQLDDQQTLADLLAQIKAQTIQAYAHQQYPFDELIDELALHRDLSRSPLFDVLLAVQNHVMTDRDYTIGGHRATSFATPEISSKYDLSFYVESGTDSVAIAVEYCTDLFESATIERMLTHLEAILSQLVSTPEQLVGELDILSADERQRVVIDFNRTGQAYDLSQPVHAHFEQQVLRTPNAVALRYKQRSYTYAQLNERANKLAHYLIAEQGIKPDDLVAVMAGRSDFTLIALLGIMKAGAAYLPVAADLPAERIRYMLSDSGVQVVLASQFVGEVATAVRHVAYIEQLLQTKHSTTNPAVALSTQSRMYVMYTSGSTGKPKGVELRHRSVLNFLFSMQAYFGLAPEQVFLSVTTFIFDISVMEFFLPLLNGASVRIATKADIQDPDQLAELIEQAQPDLMQATPSLWQMLVDTGWKGHKTMRILCGGEKLSRPLGEQLLSRGRELWNLYGPTETTIWSAIQPVQTTADLATIGKPIANTQVYIVDPIGNLCGLGVFGEICIAGEGLAQGYLNRPDLTSAKFVPNLTDANSLMYRTGDRGRWLANGEIEFLGRSDNQVKIHGHRIELGEIEEVLLNYAGISQAVVTVHDGGQNDKELVAYLVVDQEVRVEDIRQHVGRHVASYMIPTRFLRVRTMPMTANQKVDRNALSPGIGTPLSQPTSVLQPEVQINVVLEEQIAAVVCRVIRVESVGMTDNLFECGLNSIRVVALRKLLTDTYPESVDIHEIFSNPTVRQLTQLIGSRFDSQVSMAIAQTEEINF